MNATPIPEVPLPAEVQAALERGDALEAIKLLRAATGIGLKEAKDIIDGHSHGVKRQTGPATPSALPAGVVSALQRGAKIEAIKLLREATGLGLKEAKDIVDSQSSNSPTYAAQRAPGEIPRSKVAAWFIVCVLVAGALAYYFLGGAS